MIEGLSTLPALTVRQPYAFALAAGVKPVENRSWSPNAKYLGEPFALHAGQSWNATLVRRAVEQWFRYDAWKGPVAEKLSTVDAVVKACEETIGAVLAVGYLDRVEPPPIALLTARSGEIDRGSLYWRIPDTFGWFFRDVVPFGRPVPAKGRERIWHLPLVLDERVRRAWRDSDGGSFSRSIE